MPEYHIPRADFKIFSVQEILPYIREAPDIDYKAMIALAWLTGSRIQELCNLLRKDIIISSETRDIMFIIHALKHGKIGYPSFSFDDPFVEDIIAYVKEMQPEQKVFARGKRAYQKILWQINSKLYPEDIAKAMAHQPCRFLTFHYLRHSRLTYLARVLRAYPEEFKSWTGHASSAFEDYFAARRVERFKGRFNEKEN